MHVYGLPYCQIQQTKINQIWMKILVNVILMLFGHEIVYYGSVNVIDFVEILKS